MDGYWVDSPLWATDCPPSVIPLSLLLWKVWAVRSTKPEIFSIRRHAHRHLAGRKIVRHRRRSHNPRSSERKKLRSFSLVRLNELLIFAWKFTSPFAPGSSIFKAGKFEEFNKKIWLARRIEHFSVKDAFNPHRAKAMLRCHSDNGWE